LIIFLPRPMRKGRVSLEEVLWSRRSRREYGSPPLKLEELGQVLWAAQGVSDPELGLRTAPSVDSTYPLELYVAVRDEGLEDASPGVYRYMPIGHSLELHLSGDVVEDLYHACFDQEWVKRAPVVIVIAGWPKKLTRKYGERGLTFMYIEAGHVGQNIYLEAEALGLATVAIGLLDEGGVIRALKLPRGLVPVYLFPLGRKV